MLIAEKNNRSKRERSDALVNQVAFAGYGLFVQGRFGSFELNGCLDIGCCSLNGNAGALRVKFGFGARGQAQTAEQ